ncbi:unnamed protein product [Ostreobium quekettii]|uniref:Uncharacterized protein n=1 Tax=Ostreobium quekettii TaxID=121088 RepID=A0A8S1J924_9CHLO|nr:unnamed protein product [Ostreobium quekettii]
MSPCFGPTSRLGGRLLMNIPEIRTVFLCTSLAVVPAAAEWNSWGRARRQVPNGAALQLVLFVWGAKYFLVFERSTGMEPCICSFPFALALALVIELRKRLRGCWCDIIRAY